MQLLMIQHLSEYASPCSTHETALGVESGKISNAQITSSSIWSAALSTQQGRLNGPTSWSVRVNNINQWIQVDLGRKDVITAIATQGRHNFNQWVKSYYLSYSEDGESFEDYKTLNGVKKASIFSTDYRYTLPLTFIKQPPVPITQLLYFESNQCKNQIGNQSS
jgi:hypothetical protein